MVQKTIRPLYISILVILLLIFVPGYVKFIALYSKNKYLEKEITRLEKENKKLSEEKKRLENDIGYVEKVARESMGVTKEGEILVEIKR